MADFAFNIAKGRIVEFYNRVKSNDPANSAFVIMLLKTAEADATLEAYDTFAAILAGSNTEADFTNYARLPMTDADLAALPAPDDVNNRYQIDLPDQSIAAAGGTTDNTLAKAIVGYDSDTTAGTDADIVPCLGLDCVITTNGLTLYLNWPNDTFRAA